jgi:malonyl-CoA/methylmalonyl-CoA synthetase
MTSANLIHVLYGGRDPQGPALKLPDGRVITTRELRDDIARYAAALAALGVSCGDRVSFKLEKAPEVLMLAHACLQLGAVLHPLNTTYTDEETVFLLKDAEPRLFVCGEAERHRLASFSTDIAAIETLGEGGTGTLAARAAAASPLASVAPVSRDAPAAILYTSGTTGKPKGAQITHGNLAESARALASVWRLGASDTLLHALPVYHAHGLLTAINTLLIAGGSILFLPGFDAREVAAAFPSASVMMGVPTHYARLLREPGFAEAARVSRALLISGSAPLPQELSDRFGRETGQTIIERYGSTETAIVTAIPAGCTDRSGWVGWPLPGVEIRVADDAAARAALSSVGTLETRGHNVFAGYWKRPDADRESFTDDGWFITGDIAEIDATGCVRLLGRSKDLIISGGLNVYPKEVETVLDALPGIAESAVFGVPHPDFGEAVVAAVVLAADADFDERALVASSRGRLAAYKSPKRLIPVAEIPKNRMGKVLKSDLRATYRSLFAEASA